MRSQALLSSVQRAWATGLATSGGALPWIQSVGGVVNNPLAVQPTQQQQQQQRLGSSKRWASGLASSQLKMDTGSSADQTAQIFADLFDNDQRSSLTPVAIVEQLDRFIVGQKDAKVRNMELA